jgi:hypothetical protein
MTLGHDGLPHCKRCHDTRVATGHYKKPCAYCSEKRG